MDLSGHISYNLLVDMFLKDCSKNSSPCGNYIRVVTYE